MIRDLVLLGFLIQMTSAISLVEILFKTNIAAARCEAQCLEAESPGERARCVSLCRVLEADPEADLCSLSSVCTGGCLVACEAARTASKVGVKITEARMETCDLSWNLDSDTEEDVVFVVAGRDRAGMWSLITDSLALTSLELSTGLADRMAEVVVFAVTGAGLEDSVRLDVSSNRCLETIPRPREWRGEQQEDREARIQHSTSIVAAVVLALLGVCVLLFSVASVLVRLRARSGAEEEVRGQGEARELPYSPPVKRPLVTEEQSGARAETILQPGDSSVREEESDQYEEVYVLKSDPSII